MSFFPAAIGVLRAHPGISADAHRALPTNPGLAADCDWSGGDLQLGPDVVGRELRQHVGGDHLGALEPRSAGLAADDVAVQVVVAHQVVAGADLVLGLGTPGIMAAARIGAGADLLALVEADDGRRGVLDEAAAPAVVDVGRPFEATHLSRHDGRGLVESAHASLPSVAALLALKKVLPEPRLFYHGGQNLSISDNGLIHMSKRARFAGRIRNPASAKASAGKYELRIKGAAATASS